VRILVHDFAGHAFPVQLSRWLADRGHTVRHVYSAAAVSAPPAPSGVPVTALGRGGRLDKYRPLRRLVQEDAYARELAALAAAFRPGATLSGNCSPAIQIRLARATQRAGGRFVYWLQDLYAPALHAALSGRVPPLAGPAAALAARLEGRFLRASDAVVAITPDFLPALAAAGVPEDRCLVQPNWAPLTAARDDEARAWRRAWGLADRFVYLYTGALGLKHQPERLAALAAAQRQTGAVVLVVSQGPGRQRLAALKAAHGLDNLWLCDYLAAAALPVAQRAADVLLAVLTEAAGAFSVPSKILGYLVAGRPVLAALPTANLAARTLAEAGAGLRVAPGDADGWLAAAEALRRDPARRAALGSAGRAFAESRFALDRIGARFEALLTGRGLLDTGAAPDVDGRGLAAPGPASEVT